MKKIWSSAEEAAALASRFEGVKQAKFAREHKIPGGPSMLSQHIHGRRPLNLEAAMAYARGFGVPLSEISPRLAAAARAASNATAGSSDELNSEDDGDTQKEQDVILSTEKEWRLFRAFQLLADDEEQADLALLELEKRVSEVLGKRLLEERLGAKSYASNEKVSKTVKPATRRHR